MNVTLSIDEQVVARARKKAKALGKSLNELIRDYLQKLAGGDNAERSIEEFERLSGRGHSRGWRFNRDEIHERSSHREKSAEDELLESVGRMIDEAAERMTHEEFMKTAEKSKQTLDRAIAEHSRLRGTS